MHILHSLIHQLDGNEFTHFCTKLKEESKEDFPKVLELIILLRDQCKEPPDLEDCAQFLYEDKSKKNNVVKLKGRLKQRVIKFLITNRTKMSSQKNHQSYLSILQNIPLLLLLKEDSNSYLKQELAKELIHKCIHNELFGIASDLEKLIINSEQESTEAESSGKFQVLSKVITCFRSSVKKIESDSLVFKRSGDDKWNIAEINETQQIRQDGSILNLYKEVLLVIKRYESGKVITNKYQKELIDKAFDLLPEVNSCIDICSLMIEISLNQGQVLQGKAIFRKLGYNERVRVNSKAFSKLMKIQFHIYSYESNFEGANLTISDLLRNSDANSKDLPLYSYWQAWTLFNLGRYQEAFAQINKNIVHSSWDPGWEICRKLLHIILCIQLHRVDLAETTLQNLKKQLKRYATSDPLRKRYSIVILVLSKIISITNYPFNTSNKRNHSVIVRSLSDLEGNSEDIKWQFGGAEIAPLHLWLTKYYNQIRKTKIFS